MSTVIKERGLDLYQYLTASMLGGLADPGLLNQGSANIVGKRTGEKLAEFFVTEGMNLTGNGPEDLNTFIEKVGIAGEFRITRDGEKIVVAIPTPLCRYCPKAVGGAETPGTAYPIPGMLESFLNYRTNGGWKLVYQDGRPLVKDGTDCVITYSEE